MNADSGRLTDDDLLRRMIAGDEEAFTLLYRRRQGGVYRFALQMTGSASIAEDVTQEVFMVLICEAERFDPSKGSLRAFLHGIARYHVLRHLEGERAYVPIVGSSDGDASDQPRDELFASEDPLRDLTQAETVERVRQAVLALPANYREVVVLCDLGETGYADAAAALDCAVGTVRSRLHRARALLLRKLGAAREAEPNVNRG
jgi:RNA polymerase sigma-70 factor (ECF subfamily)